MRPRLTWGELGQSRLFQADLGSFRTEVNSGRSRLHSGFSRPIPTSFPFQEKQDIPYIYLTKWWFGCFLDRVPFSLALRLWDVFLIEGDPILIAMAFNIFKMHEKTIRKQSMETFMEFIQNDIAQNFGYSDDEVMHSLRETLSKLKVSFWVFVQKNCSLQTFDQPVCSTRAGSFSSLFFFKKIKNFFKNLESFSEIYGISKNPQPKYGKDAKLKKKQLFLQF